MFPTVHDAVKVCPPGRSGSSCFVGGGLKRCKPPPAVVAVTVALQPPTSLRWSKKDASACLQKPEQQSPLQFLLFHCRSVREIILSSQNKMPRQPKRNHGKRLGKVSPAHSVARDEGSQILPLEPEHADSSRLAYYLKLAEVAIGPMARFSRQRPSRPLRH